MSIIVLLKNLIKRIGVKLGIEVGKYPNKALQSRLEFMRVGSFDAILDVGANVGQFGEEIRHLGYGKDIISFEPVKDAFVKLKQKSLTDGKWIAYNYALGSQNEEAEINVSKHSASSSVLNFDDDYLEKNKNFEIEGKESIQIKTLDSVFSTVIAKEYKHILLKIDTQGFEKQVIDGALASLKYIDAIQIETSMNALYKGETLFIEMLTYLEGLGYEIFTLEPYYYDINSKRLLQVEVFLIKNKI